MKINVEIITGFLGAGKTLFLNSLINETQVEDEKVLVFQLEQGKSKIYKSNDINYPIKIIYIKELDDFKEKVLHEISKYKPNRILIEYNGTADINEILEILNEKIYKEHIKISTIYFIGNCISLKEYIDNIGSFIVPFIKNANMIILNNIDECSKEQLDKCIERVKNINPKSYVLKIDNKYTMKHNLRESRVFDNGLLKKIKVKLQNNFTRGK